MTSNLHIDGAGVTRQLGPHRHEAVRWDELERVLVVTTADGPWVEDLFFVLEARDGTGCVIPGGMAQEHGLLEALQRRLGAAFDNEAVIQAATCTDDATFTCWSIEGGAR